MSFTFKWPRFSDQFHANAIQMLDAALNKGNKPPVIADKIEVVELEMGTQPPELEVRDIGELTMDQFRGIFRLTYEGDAHIVLRTKVQANPLNHKQPDIHMLGGSRGMLAAKQPLVVPMLLRLSHFKLDSYVVLVVSRQKGITLVFKTDPLQNVDINSTFDSIAVIQKFIQREIEGQLRQMFREDLPGIIHRLSQQWVKAKVEAPYLTKRPSSTRQWSGAASDTGIRPYDMPPRMSPVGTHPLLARTASVASGGVTRPRSGSGSSGVGRRPSSVVSTPTHQTSGFDENDTPFGDPDQRSMFNTFRNLFTPTKGLAELAEENSDIDDGETYDSGNWEDLMPPEPSEVGDVQEYETVPAVGGGFITRPRVIHAHSQIMSPSREPSRPPSRTASRASGPSRLPSLMSPGRSVVNSPIARQLPSAVAMERAHSWGGTYNPYFAGMTPRYATPGPFYDDQFERGSSRGGSARPSPPHPHAVPNLVHPYPRRTSSPSSVRTRTTDMTQSISTPPNAPEDDGGVRINRSRRPSFSSSTDPFGSPTDPLSFSEHDPKIVLKPTLNSVSRLSLLSNSYHTLSPYTRTLEHFTVRSVPPRESTSSGSGSAAERQPAKARRKRTYYLGGKKQSSSPDPSPPPIDDASRPVSPEPGLSDYDASDMERYFRSTDDLVPQYPDVHPSHIRRRSRYQP